MSFINCCEVAMMCLPMEICCCCVSLELGAKILGVVHMILSFLIAMVYGIVSAELTYLAPPRRLFYGLVSAASTAALLPAALMTYGAFRRKPKFLWPWVVLAWFSSVTLVGMAVLGTMLMTVPEERNNYSEISTMISVYFLYAVILYYSASVVNSRRLELTLEDRSESEQRLMRRIAVPKTVLYEGYEGVA